VGKSLALPNVRTEDDHSCGAAVFMAVGRYFGVGSDTLDEWKDELDTSRKGGTKPSAGVAFLRELCLAVEEREGLTVEDLHAFTSSGRPVVCCVQAYGDEEDRAEASSGHYVVVTEVADDVVFF
jgi:hypothetical protein